MLLIKNTQKIGVAENCTYLGSSRNIIYYYNFKLINRTKIPKKFIECKESFYNRTITKLKIMILIRK